MKVVIPCPGWKGFGAAIMWSCSGAIENEYTALTELRRIARGDPVRLVDEKLTFSPYRDLAVPEHPVLTLETTKGTMVLVLDRDAAPVHVANAVGLVRKGFFDGKTWQRVVPNFVIQGGAPSPLGSEGQEWLLRAEVNRSRFGRGAVGMSRGDLFGTGDSEFFAGHVPAPHLDGQYTRFGQVVRGLDVLDRIEAGDLILRATVRGTAAGDPEASGSGVDGAE